MQDLLVPLHSPEVLHVPVGGVQCPYGWMAWKRQKADRMPHTMYEGLIRYRGLVFMLDLWVPMEEETVSSIDIFPLSTCCLAPLSGKQDPDWQDICSECGTVMIRGHEVGSAAMDGGQWDELGKAYLEEWLILHGTDPLTSTIRVSELFEAIKQIPLPTESLARGYADNIITPFARELLALRASP